MSWLVLFRKSARRSRGTKDYTTYIPWLLFEAFDQGMEIEDKGLSQVDLGVRRHDKVVYRAVCRVAEVTACKLDGYRSVCTFRKVSQSLLVDT